MVTGLSVPNARTLRTQKRQILRARSVTACSARMNAPAPFEEYLGERSFLPVANRKANPSKRPTPSSARTPTSNPVVAKPPETSRNALISNKPQTNTTKNPCARPNGSALLLYHSTM